MSQQQVHVDELDTVIVNFSPHLVSPERLLDESDIGSNFSKLPASVRAYIREAFLPKKGLRGLRAIIKRTRDYLERETVKTDLGPATSVSRAGDIHRKLEEESQAFAKAKEQLINDLDQLYAEAETELRDKIGDPVTADAVLAAVRERRPDAEALRWRIDFRYRCVMVGPVDGRFDPQLDDAIRQGFTKLREGLFGDLVAEISSASSRLKTLILDRLTKKRSRVIPSTTVERFREEVVSKVKKLAFIDKKRCKTLAASIDQALAVLPAGKMEGSSVDDFLAILSACGDQRHLLSTVEKGTPLLTVEKAKDQESAAAKTPAETTETTSKPAQGVKRPAAAAASIRPPASRPSSRPASVQGAAEAKRKKPTSGAFAF